MDLIKFLIQAKINTYATFGERAENILDDNAKELTFEKSEFKYRDRYFGSNPFIGEEIVWRDNKPIWGMNYYGSVIFDIVPAKDVYQFLKKAMCQVSEERPFRGPDKFSENDFEYFDKSEGDVNSFRGIEKIKYRGQEVYRLFYHGGSIDFKA